MKRLIKRGVVLGLLAMTNSALAQGIPTYDASTVIQLQQQYQQMKQQYEALTGNGGFNALGYNDAVAAAAIVPGSWQDVVANQAKGVYGARQQHYEQSIQTLPPEGFTDPNGQDAVSYRMSTDAVRSSLAGGDQLYGAVQTHLNNITALGHRVDATDSLKEAQDLQNRIATETAMMQTAAAKLNALTLNLQANMVNAQNQAVSANKKFYTWQPE